MDKNDLFPTSTLFIINLSVVICAEKRHPITSFANTDIRRVSYYNDCNPSRIVTEVSFCYNGYN